MSGCELDGRDRFPAAESGSFLFTTTTMAAQGSTTYANLQVPEALRS
jgi:hypothetical protein